MLLLKRSTIRTLEEVLSAKNRLFPLLFRNSPCYSWNQRANYVNVYMKWKKDRTFDKFEITYRSLELKRVITMKNVIARSPDGCIPISDVSKRGKELGIFPMKVAKFLRMYPTVFKEFVGPQYNLPWFRLTPEATAIDIEEKAVYENYKLDLRLRLKKFIMMNKEKRLPLRIISGMQWYLGLPDDFLKNPEQNLDESFKFVDLEDGEKALAVDCTEKILSTLQTNAIIRGEYNGDWMEPISFPLYPAKCSTLRKKIAIWLVEFQKLPYVSPYEDFSHLWRGSDLSEKRIVGVVHELLSLFVEHAAQRRKLLCLKKFIHLPQQFHRVFERHPHMFYVSRKAKTCTAVLREAYRDKTAIPRHPLFPVRKRYIELLKASRMIRKEKISNHLSRGHKSSKLYSDSDDSDSDSDSDSRSYSYFDNFESDSESVSDSDSDLDELGSDLDKSDSVLDKSDSDLDKEQGSQRSVYQSSEIGVSSNPVCRTSSLVHQSSDKFVHTGTEVIRYPVRWTVKK